MTISKDLFLSILAMDASIRGNTVELKSPYQPEALA
jgi:hypothetical protein